MEEARKANASAQRALQASRFDCLGSPINGPANTNLSAEEI